MGKSNNANKGKDKVVEGSKAKKLSSTRTIQPRGIQIREGGAPQPMETDLLPLPPPEGMVYPFGKKPRFSDEHARKLYKLFSTYEVIPIILPDSDDLASLGLLDELVELFDASNLMWMFKSDPGSYKELMSEFYASLVVTWKDGTTERGKDEVKVAVGWKFQLGGREFAMTSGEVQSLLSINGEGELPKLSDREIHSFWNSIAHWHYSRVYIKKNRTVTMLVNLLDKVVHRLLARNLYPRLDKGRFVNKKDLKVMMLIKEKKKLDVFSLLSNHFVDYQDKGHKGIGIGGGNIISWIAVHLGFALDTSYVLEGERLTQEYMQHARMIDQASKEPLIKKSSIGENRSGKVKYVPSSNAAPPSEPNPNQTPYAFEDARAVCESLSRKHETLAKSQEDLASFVRNEAAWSHGVVSWSQDVVAWQSKMFGDLYSHMGWPGYVPAPSPPTTFGYPYPPPPSTFHHSNDEAGPSSGTREYVDDEEDDEDVEDTEDTSGSENDDGNEDDDSMSEEF